MVNKNSIWAPGYCFKTELKINCEPNASSFNVCVMKCVLTLERSAPLQACMITPKQYISQITVNTCLRLSCNLKHTFYWSLISWNPQLCPSFANIYCKGLRCADTSTSCSLIHIKPFQGSCFVYCHSKTCFHMKRRKFALPGPSSGDALISKTLAKNEQLHLISMIWFYPLQACWKTSDYLMRISWFQA